MRILQLNCFADPVGGAETYMLRLSEELERRGHEVALFGTSPERDLALPRRRVVRRPAYDSARLFRDEPVRLALEEEIARLDPQVVHVHNLHPLGLDLIELLRASGRPIVQTVHDLSIVCPNSWCVRGDGTPCPGGAGAQCFRYGCERNYPYDARQVFLTSLRLRLVRDLVDVAISPSDFLAELLRNHGYRDVRRVPYFVQPAPPENERRERDPHSLLFLGRLVPEKGVDVLLQAMPAILREESATRLCVVGGGPQSGALRSLARRLGLREAVRFRAKVPHREVAGFYASASALIVPSIWSENSPVTIYESLSAGLPVLASRIGGIPDLVEENRTGMLFEPRDPAALASTVLRFLRTSAEVREELSAHSRERSREFSLERNLAAVEGIYSELSARGPASRGRLTLEWDEDLRTVLTRLDAERCRLDGHARYLEGFRNPLGWIYERTRSRVRKLALRTGLIRR